MKQIASSVQARAGSRVAQSGFEMLLCKKMISCQMISGAQHRFSVCHVVGILNFRSHFLASCGDIECAVNVCCPTRKQEQSTQKPEFAGKVLLREQNVERPRVLMLIFQPAILLCPARY
jgi:hypothetical protein